MMTMRSLFGVLLVATCAMAEPTDDLIGPGFEIEVGLALALFISAGIMLFNGDFGFQLLGTVIVTLIFFVNFRSSLAGFPEPQGTIITVEVCALVAVACYQGFEGVKVLIGAAVGVLIAGEVYSIYGATKGGAPMENDHPYGTSLSGCALVILGVAIFLFPAFRKLKVLVYVIFGGLLVSACGGYLLMFFVTCTHGTPFGGEVLNGDGLSKPSPLINFLKSLTVPGAYAVGIFRSAGAGLNPVVSGQQIYLDKVVGWLTWFFLARIGWFAQADAPIKKTVKPYPTSVSARELSQPLV